MADKPPQFTAPSTTEDINDSVLADLEQRMDILERNQDNVFRALSERGKKIDELWALVMGSRSSLIRPQIEPKPEVFVTPAVTNLLDKQVDVTHVSDLGNGDCADGNSGVSVTKENDDDQSASKEVADIVAFKVFEEMPEQTEYHETKKFYDILKEVDATDLSEDCNALESIQFFGNNHLICIVDNVFDEMPMIIDGNEDENFDELISMHDGVSKYVIQGSSGIDTVIVLTNFDPGGKEPLITVVDHQAVGDSQRLIGCSRRQIVPGPSKSNLSIDRIICKSATTVPQYEPHKAEFGKPILLPFDRGRTCYVPAFSKHRSLDENATHMGKLMAVKELLLQLNIMLEMRKALLAEDLTSDFLSVLLLVDVELLTDVRFKMPLLLLDHGAGILVRAFKAQFSSNDTFIFDPGGQRYMVFAAEVLGDSSTGREGMKNGVRLLVMTMTGTISTILDCWFVLRDIECVSVWQESYQPAFIAAKKRWAHTSDGVSYFTMEYTAYTCIVNGCCKNLVFILLLLQGGSISHVEELHVFRKKVGKLIISGSSLITLSGASCIIDIVFACSLVVKHGGTNCSIDAPFSLKVLDNEVGASSCYADIAHVVHLLIQPSRRKHYMKEVPDDGRKEYG